MTAAVTTAATVRVDFRLSAPQDADVAIPRGSVVATRRTVTDTSTAFTTLVNAASKPSPVSFTTMPLCSVMRDSRIWARTSLNAA